MTKIESKPEVYRRCEACGIRMGGILLVSNPPVRTRCNDCGGAALGVHSQYEGKP